jgi:uncharacterized protein
VTGSIASELRKETARSKAVVEGYWRARIVADREGGDPLEQSRERVRRYFHPEVRYECMGRFPVAGVYVGRDAVVERFFAETKARLSGTTVEILEIFGQGDRVCLRSQIQSRGPTGLPYNNRYCFVYRVHDGQITEVLEFVDTELTHTAMFGMRDPCRDGHTCLVSLEQAQE